ncbi:prepilin-type N-terminal cleavage/methylation domain-containing protein [Clostridium tetanomorphum]|uniref:Type II secretion system protein n=1 Tax=Clostridium tetanomorphum TaxID=1553 RepID=A0A923J346_CLOTT|nr:type II secretion system protein [Clostridium tetanomorphum]KAJ51628.1 hypothetical protein CTM_11835 [Clostridium tetanomorphum DSM 665]KAJ53635.1 hypothetical protein CTM_01604 [Clostridium tetanomorphum DSM 665]MBC2399638.1 type II secretion system protein [Clostridium tetanomorphum]MBP1866242.1 prepilin-type N-terminal cleavage/methylation domain-containing protein [Clostridium tetanomorphum]NRS86014.1 prepilin-type N-terminal cleavage/methylation domain-containing protein [Clostridium 
MFKFKAYKKGFTLTEVIIAMVLILSTVAISSKVAFSALKVGNTNKQELEGTIIAQNYLEKIRAARDNKIITNNSTLDEYIKSLGFNKEENYRKEDIKDGIEYKVALSTDNIEKTDVGNLLQLIVEVKPQDSNSIKIGTRIFFK